MRVAHIVAALLFVSLGAQREPAPTLSVVDVRPDSANPRSIILVSFDRPVINALEGAPSPTAHVRIEPNIDASIEWRNPVTLRIVPRRPLQSGVTYTVRIDTTLIAFDGARLVATASHGVHVGLPRTLARAPYLSPNSTAQLPRDGRIKLFVSAALAELRFDFQPRLELLQNDECKADTIPYVAAAHRQLQEGESIHQPLFSRNGTVDTLERVLEFQPARALPEGCWGHITIPEFTSTGVEAAKYAVRTIPPFDILDRSCLSLGQCVSPSGVNLHFRAPIDSSASRFVRIDAAVPYTIDSINPITSGLRIYTKIQYRSPFRIVIDTAIRDVYGRRFAGPNVVRVELADEQPRVGYATGQYIVPRREPQTLTVQHINADTLSVRVYKPSFRDALSFWMQPGRMASEIPKSADSTVFLVPVRAPFNTFGITNIPLPAEVSQASGIVLVTVSVHSMQRAPGTVRGLGRAVADGLRPTARYREPLPPQYASLFVAQFSNLAVHARIPGVSPAFFITQSTTGTPVRNASVTLRDLLLNEVVSGTTDASGVLHLVGTDARVSMVAPFDLSTRGASVAQVQVGDESLFVPFVNYPAVRGISPVSPWPQLNSGVHWASSSERVDAWTDRAIYRPGEMLYVAAVHREALEYATSHATPGVPMRIALKNERGAVIRDSIVHTSVHGIATDSVRLSQLMRSGHYVIEVQREVNGAWRSLAYAPFRVAEYRVPEFLVAVDSVGQSLTVDDSVHYDVTAAYLHGAPVRDATVHASAELNSTNGGLKGLPDGFRVGTTEYHERVRTKVPNIKGSPMNASGSSRLTFNLPEIAAKGPLMLTLTSSVVDISQQQVTQSAQRLVHTSDFYVATRASTTVTFGDTIRIPVVAIDRDGNWRSGVQVVVTLATSSIGERYRRVLDTITSVMLQTADTVVYAVFPSTKDGAHVVILNAKDDRGRTTESDGDVYVMPLWRTVDPNTRTKLTVKVQDTILRVGDTAIVRFESPFDVAEAWLTVERDGVQQSIRKVVARGADSVLIPVTQRHAPNVFVGVTLVPKGVDWSTTAGVQERMQHGYASFRVDAMDKVLSLDVALDRTQYGPSDSATISVVSSDRNGAPVSGAAIIWAVDEGILALQRFAIPTLSYLWHGPVFPRTQSLSTAAYHFDSLSQHRFGYGALVERGQTAGQGAVDMVQSMPVSAIAGIQNLQDAVRSNFRSTAFFRVVTLDSTGRGSVVQRLPDNLSRFRVFAVALDSTNRAGADSTDFSITRSLVTRAALPRFVRAGDSVSAAMLVSTTDGTARTVNVSVQGEGVRLIGNTQSRANASALVARVPFSFTTLDSEVARFQLLAQDSVDADGLISVLPVKPVAHRRVLSTAGSVDGSTQIRIALPATTDIPRSTITLRVGNSPVPILRTAANFALTYPYDGSEQLASNVRILAAVLRLDRAGQHVSTDSAATRDALTRMASQLELRVASNGMVRPWSSGGTGSVWLTAYVGQALIDARDAGVPVDPEPLVAIGNVFHNWKFPGDTTLGTSADKAQMLRLYYATALEVALFNRRAARADTTTELKLFSERARMAWEDRALLASLFITAGDTANAATILDELWRDVRPAGVLVDLPVAPRGNPYPSALRAAARLLDASTRIQLTHPLLGALAERVMQMGRATNAWCNTQDYAALVPAIVQWAGDTPPRDLTVRVVGTSTRSAAWTAAWNTGQVYDTTVNLASFARPVGDSLIVTMTLSTDNARAYYAVSVSEFPSVRTTTPDRRGLVVQRWVERYSDGRHVTEVAAGDLVRVHLRISASASREFVAVEDWLPAGLEVMDPSLRTSSSLAAFTDDQSQRAAEQSDEELEDEVGTYNPFLYWFGPWDHRELKDDRVVWYATRLPAGNHHVSYVARATTAGRFVRPPAIAEEMYNPGVNGRSEGGWFEVRSDR